MKISRPACLVAATAMALAEGLVACHIYVDEPPEVAAAPPPPRPPPPRRAPPPQPAPRPVPPPSSYPQAPQPVKVVAVRQSPPATQTAEPSPGPATAPAPGPALTAAPAPESPPALACLDTGAVIVGDCSALKAPAGCAPAAAPAQRCSAFKAYFDPKVAVVAVSCVAALGAQACDLARTSACTKAALVQACADPSVSQLCQIATTPCKTTASECGELLSGLNEEGQQRVAQCVAQGCGGGLMACIDGLK
jgi:hypothetical protein